MDVYIDEPLAIGWLPGSIEPPKLTGTFFVKAAFAMSHGHMPLLVEEPVMLGGDSYADEDPQRSLFYSTDFAPFKPRADVLLVGNCHAVGDPVPHLQASLRVGELAKTLDVFGDRFWKGMFGTSLSDPALFSEMPLDYERTYGGPDFANNPLGKGHVEKAVTESGYQRLPAPNVQHPGNPTDQNPASFGPVDPNWPQRMKHVGTFDSKWEKTRWPWFPEDFNWSYFNAAPNDQQVEGYLRGDEPLEIQNMHPKHAVYQSQLPGVRARTFVTKRIDGETVFCEIPMVLDTLWIDMHAEQFILVWRGRTEIKTIKMREFEQVLAAIEPLDATYTESDYREELQRRIAAQQPVEDLPEDPVAQAAFDNKFADMEKDIAAMEARMAKAEKEAQQQINQSLAESDIVPPKLDQPQKANPVAAITAMLADLDNEANQGGDPEQTEALRAELTRMKAEREEFDKDMQAARAELADVASEAWTRERVIQAATNGESLADANLAELDLSDLELSDLDFTGARLSKANLSQSNLSNANLTSAHLKEADLTAANLTGATLDEANLNKATLTDARVTRLSLTRATLTDLELAGADFSSCTGEYADFSRSNLTGASFQKVNLPHVIFCECQIDQANFAGAEIPNADFEGATAQQIQMNDAQANGLRGSDGVDFTESNFQNAHLNGAIFDESTVTGCDFSGASLDGAMFSDVHAARANFQRASLIEGRFDDANLEQANLLGANLLRCSFERANLTDTNLEQTNLFESGFWDATFDNTKLAQANTKGTMLS